MIPYAKIEDGEGRKCGLSLIAKAEYWCNAPREAKERFYGHRFARCSNCRPTNFFRDSNGKIIDMIDIPDRVRFTLSDESQRREEERELANLADIDNPTKVAFWNEVNKEN